MSDDPYPMPPHGRATAQVDAFAWLMCRDCATPTSREALSALGARCGHCHLAWQRQGHSWPPKVPAAVEAGPEHTAWARRLRWRQQQGKPLTAAQHDAWRTALRVTTTPQGAPDDGQ